MKYTLRHTGPFLIGAGAVTALIAASGPLGTSTFWVVYGCGALCIIAGGIVRLADIRKTTVAGHDEKDATGIDQAESLLEGLVEKVETIDRESERFTAEELQRIVRDVQEGACVQFIAQSQSLRDYFGIVAWSSIMSDFAQGERLFNRAWSAATDGCLPEARIAVHRALPCLKRALSTLRTTTHDATH